VPVGTAWNKTRSDGLAKDIGLLTLSNMVHTRSGASSMECQVEDAAWTFVEQVLAMVVQMRKEDSNSHVEVQTLSFGEMYSLALRMFTARKEFHELGKPTDVVLSYHYTDEANMASIRKHGLMTREERAAHNVQAATEHGADFGPGIYTASSPCAVLGSFGDVGLIVVCLLGANANHRASNSGTADSITVVRDFKDKYVILSSAKQCIPILQFRAEHIDRDRNKKGTWRLLGITTTCKRCLTIC
jgi:hypothetical protein